MSRVETVGSALEEIDSIPRDGDEPVFPAPWAATAFALTIALHERGYFTWAGWSSRLGRAIAAEDENTGEGPEVYWRCWLAALEETISTSGIAAAGVLDEIQEAWREAAAATPHGEPITLSRQVSGTLGKGT